MTIGYHPTSAGRGCGRSRRRRCGAPVAGSRIVDLGSGTGVTGFAAAALGASVTVTDQAQILFLMRQNLEANEASGAVPRGSVSVAEYR